MIDFRHQGIVKLTDLLALQDIAMNKKQEMTVSATFEPAIISGQMAAMPDVYTENEDVPFVRSRFSAQVAGYLDEKVFLLLLTLEGEKTREQVINLVNPFVLGAITDMGVAEAKTTGNDVLTKNDKKITGIATYTDNGMTAVLVGCSLFLDFEKAATALKVIKRGSLEERATSIKHETGVEPTGSEAHTKFIDAIKTQYPNIGFVESEIPEKVKKDARQRANEFYGNSDFIKYGRSYAEEG
jgi:lipoate-protein ligase A